MHAKAASRRRYCWRPLGVYAADIHAAGIPGVSHLHVHNYLLQVNPGLVVSLSWALREGVWLFVIQTVAQKCRYVEIFSVYRPRFKDCFVRRDGIIFMRR